MTLGDLFSGQWTWSALVHAILPIVLSSGVAFFAGYAYGWNRGFVLGAKLDADFKRAAEQQP